MNALLMIYFSGTGTNVIGSRFRNVPATGVPRS